MATRWDWHGMAGLHVPLIAVRSLRAISLGGRGARTSPSNRPSRNDGGRMVRLAGI